MLIAIAPVSSGLVQETGNPNPALNPETNGVELLLPDSTLKYRGVISADMASGDAAHELLVDFGSKGAWWLGGKTGSWVKVTSDDPYTMIPIEIDGDSAIEVVLDFDAKGLWLFNYSGTVSWTRLTGDDPGQMVAADDDFDGIQELSVDFDTKGLWHYDYTYGWRKRTNDNPSYGFRMDTSFPGYEETVWTFPGNGIWRVFGSPTTYWNKLTEDAMSDDCVSAELGIGDDAEEFVADLYPLGLWGYNGTTWTRLTTADPFDIRAVKFVGNPDYEFLVSFNYTTTPGLWWWNTNTGTFPGVFYKLTNDNPTHDEAFCEPFDPNGTIELTGDEEVAVDFGAKGLWLFNYSAGSWQKLTNDSPRFMVRSDLDGDGVDNYLICDFSDKGLWYYSGKTGTWTRLTGDSPDPY